jgi:hypothetical protein
LEEAVLLQQGRDDLLSFCILSNPKYNPNWHHELIANELMSIEDGSFVAKGYKILILCVPPRHGKSEEATINFPAWYLGRNPTLEVITSSYSADLAHDFGRKTRRLVSAPIYQSIFGISLASEQKAVDKWQTSKGGTYTSTGVGGAITGRGANLLIIDDPLKNREDANSITIRNKQWDWFTSTAYTRLEPGGVVVLILTRWHLDDLAGRILVHEELSKRTKLIVFPAIATDDEQYRRKGDYLWPTRYAPEEYESIKQAIGPYDWSALYQQSPILSENQEFRNDWFKHRDRAEIDRLNTRSFLTIDTAYSQRDGADYIGVTENYIDQQNNWNIAAYRVRFNPADLVNFLFTIQDKRNFEKIGIEKTAFTEGLKPFLDEEMRKRNRFLPIVALEHKQIAKETRIRGLIPRYASGSVYHIKGECAHLEEEMLQFPLGAHDDVLDSLAYQQQIAESGAGGYNQYQTKLQNNARQYRKTIYR